MNMIRQIPAWLCFFTFSLTAVICQSQEKAISITVEANRGIRDISAKYLNDPDLWEDILHANGLKTADQVFPGMRLEIPVQAISEAKSALEAATELIQKATENGAARFAVAEIDRAVKIKDEAIEKRKAGLWAECTKSARIAADQAEKALDISLKKQNVAVHAIVEYYQGDVQRLKSADSLWEEISLSAVIEEDERIRTLTRSVADILFSDNSRLKLKENSQLMIRRMRADLLNDRVKSTVTVGGGDFSALLAGGKKGNQFEVDIPGVKTNIESKQFWVRVGEKETARIANYDEGKLEIEAQGRKVVLGKNQGSVVRKNQKPSEPADLLPGPRLLEPADKAECFNTDILLTWEPVPGAESYVLELSDEENFSKPIWEQSLGKEESAAGKIRVKFPPHLGTGVFYWRVRSLSADELPGPPGITRHFRVMKDTEPPYLVILSPEQGASFTEDYVEIRGNTERDAAVTVQDQPVKAEAEGGFGFRCGLSEGENRIRVKSVDRAGNVNSLERVITRVIEADSDLYFDPSLPRAGKNHFLLKNHNFSLTGKTWPHAAISIRNIEKDSSDEQKSRKFSAAAVADTEGRFQINIRSSETVAEFAVSVISPAGETKNEHLIMEIDDQAPLIRFDEVIPSSTARKQLIIAGEAEGALSLRSNGADIPLTLSESESDKQQHESRFSFPLELKSGKNIMRLEARDIAGNIGVFEKEIFCDSDAPELAGYEFSPKKAKPGDEVRLSVRVKDATEVKKILPFEIGIGDNNYKGQMLRSDTGEEYIGLFRVPGNFSGAVKLKCITLSDYLGNTKQYEF